VPGTFLLGRFFISCCAADALPIVVPVLRGAGALPPQDRWLLVSGALVRRGTALVIAPTSMEQTPEPSSPYLSSDNAGDPPAGASRPETPVAAPPPAAPEAAPPARPKRPATPQNHGGYSGRAGRVYDTYFEHCKEFTYDALAYPKRATGEIDAARMFAGPPRELQPPAYEGCLAGLEADVATITLRDVIQALLGADEG
jgi:hypothetical protein